LVGLRFGVCAGHDRYASLAHESDYADLSFLQSQARARLHDHFRWLSAVHVARVKAVAAEDHRLQALTRAAKHADTIRG